MTDYNFVSHDDLNISAAMTVDEAWTIAAENQLMKLEYETHAAKYNWPEERKQFKKTPYWAYWFARHVIMGRWLIAEEYINSDAAASVPYRSYIHILDMLGVGQTNSDQPKHKKSRSYDNRRVELTQVEKLADELSKVVKHHTAKDVNDADS